LALWSSIDLYGHGKTEIGEMEHIRRTRSVRTGRIAW
jgi:hypothetical protein